METCKGKLCPRLKKKCIEHECGFYQYVSGKHPQTGEMMDTWDCTERIEILLLLNLGKQINDMAASLDSMRNEVNAGAGSILQKALGLKP